MTLQVGDKVVVFNAGTDYSRAVKIEPVEVGDKVTVVTLSDGTKIPLPRIDLDLSSYVFVLPKWDLPFRIGGDISWEMIPLGAAVFTVTGISCYFIEDTLREWEAGELTGLYLLMLTGYRKVAVTETINEDGTKTKTYQNYLKIASNTENAYEIGDSVLGLPIDLSFSRGFYFWSAIVQTYMGTPKEPTGGFHNLYTWGGSNAAVGIQQRCDLTGVGIVKIRFYGTVSMPTYPSGLVSIQVIFEGQGKSTTITLSANTYFTKYSGGWYSTDGTVEVTYTFDYNTSLYLWDTVLKVIIGAGTGWGAVNYDITVASLSFYDIQGNELTRPCTIGGVQVGDKYVIYNPNTKKIVFNDSSKTILSSAYWRDVITAGEEISVTPVEYIWDGQGKVYLSQSKTTLSTIMFDDLLKVVAVNGTTTKTLDYHAGESITVSGVTVQRELTNITSILRAGKNQITLVVKDTTGTKIGFPTPVYIIRSM